jgi:N-sulfoglucosamine sulfohydrolase
VPGFLPDTPLIREEIANYYSSVKRCDDTIGAVLDALDESGMRDNTIAIFISDHGMPFPMAKFNCTMNSNRVPWIMRWSGKIKPGAVESEHMISSIDLMPTLLDAIGIAIPSNLDGRTFLPLLFGKPQKGRDQVFTVYHNNLFKEKFEMRCVQEKRFGYIYNAWSDGKKTYQDEMEKGIALKAMIKAAGTDEWAKKRLQHFLYRVPEELYDYSRDPHALRNLAQVPEFKAELIRLRKQLLEWMQDENDYLLDTYQKYLNSV